MPQIEQQQRLGAKCECALSDKHDDGPDGVKRLSKPSLTGCAIILHHDLTCLTDIQEPVSDWPDPEPVA